LPSSAGNSSETPAELGISSLTTVRRATARDAAVLARIAAVTFPLACPPSTTDEAKADFIGRHLTSARFEEYLADESRLLLIAEQGNRSIGYTMLVFAAPSDADVVAAVRANPTAELSKCYVLPGLHGGGVGNALMTTTLAAARDRGVASVWLGVNQLNARANRFYEKHGFDLVGTKRFLVGDVWEHDFVREHVYNDRSTLPVGEYVDRRDQ
jgi:ribosomal protein S18 acetylase RimI-like enzyme